MLKNDADLAQAHEVRGLFQDALASVRRDYPAVQELLSSGPLDEIARIEGDIATYVALTRPRVSL